MATIVQERAERLAYLRRLRQRFRAVRNVAAKAADKANRLIERTTEKESNSTYLPDLVDVLDLANRGAELEGQIGELLRELTQAETVYQFQ